MRIVSVCRAYPTHRPGGMLFCCQDRAEELARQGHEVHVLTTGGRPDGLVGGVNVHHLPCDPMRYTNGFAEACAKFSGMLNPEVIHLDSADFDRPWWKDCCPKARRAVTMHGFTLGGWLTKWNLHRIDIDGQLDAFPAAQIKREAKLLAGFDAVLAISTHEQYLLEDCYGLNNVKLVYNPIAPYFFERGSELEREPKRFICAAISGHGPRLFRLAELAARKAKVSLQVASDCARSGMPMLYDQAVALIVPTAYAQGYDLTIAESLARRRPVMVARTGSYYRESSEVIQSFPLGDVDAMARMLKAWVKSAPKVSATAADRHRPGKHAQSWLEAVLWAD